ncbi:MAG: LptF/LptG family permease, partial [Puniceicoccales bacterium]|nr:LptF/LptG family permease [Puniceicoccales bacterium]
MSLLYRYLFKEFGLASTFTVGVFVFVLLIGNALKDVLSLLSSGKISGSIFWDVLFHLTPSLVAYAVPLGLLTGTLLVLGKLSSQNEITAMKASGISLFFILRPLLHLALLFTLLSLAVNFYFGPRSIAYYRTCLANLVRKNPLEFIQEGVFVKDFPQYTLYIGSKQSEWIRDCWLWELDPSRPGGVNVFLHAKTGR